MDGSPGAPTVEEQERDPASLLNTVKAILALRHAESDLQARPNFAVLHAEKGKLPFVYRRGSLIVAVNHGVKTASAELRLEGRTLYTLGKCSLENGLCQMEGQSFGVWKG